MYGTSIVNTSSSSSADKILKVIGHGSANDDSSGSSLFTSHSGTSLVLFSIHITGTTYAVGYSNALAQPCVRIVTYSGSGNPTVGSEYVLFSGNQDFFGMYNHPTDTDKLFVCYSNGTNIIYGVLTFSGTTISTNNTTTSSYDETQMLTRVLLNIPGSASTFMWPYLTGSETSVRVAHVSVSGTSVTETLGAAFTISAWGSSLSTTVYVLPLSTTRVLVYGAYDSAKSLQARLLSISTATFGAELSSGTNTISGSYTGGLKTIMYTPDASHRGFAFIDGSNAVALIPRTVGQAVAAFTGIHWQSSDDTLIFTYGLRWSDASNTSPARRPYAGVFSAGLNSFITMGSTKNNLVYTVSVGAGANIQWFYCRVPSARATINGASVPNAGVLASAQGNSYAGGGSSAAIGTFASNTDMTYGVFVTTDESGGTFVHGIDFTTN